MKSIKSNIDWTKRKRYIAKGTEQLQNEVSELVKSENEMVHNILIGVGKDGVQLTVLPVAKSILDWKAEEMGFLEDVELETASGKEVFEKVNTQSIHVRLESAKYTKYFSELNAKLVVFNGKPDMLYEGTVVVSGKKVKAIVSYNRKGLPATQEEIDNAIELNCVFWSSGQHKKNEFTGLNMNTVASVEEGEEVLETLTSGQYFFYKNKYGVELVWEDKLATLYGRGSHVKSPSLSFDRVLATKYSKPQQNASIGFIVGAAEDLNDGAAYIRAAYVVEKYNQLFNKNYTAADFIGFTSQNRANGSLKAKTEAVSDSTMVELIKYHVIRNGGKIHHFTRSEIANDPTLKHAIMSCLDKDVVEPFSKHDLIIVSDEGCKLPDYLVDKNVVKASFDPTMELGYNQMLYAKKKPYNRGTASMQLLMSCFYANPKATIQFLSLHLREQFQGKIDNIGNTEKGGFVSFDLVEGDKFHHNTVAKMIAPELSLMSKAMFEEQVNDIIQAINRGFDKNRYEGFDGGYFYANLDFGRHFDVQLLAEDEVYMQDYALYYNRRMKKLVEKELELLELKATASDDEIKQIDTALRQIYTEARVLKEGKVVMYRSPKMSIYEVAVRKVVTFEDIVKRAKSAGFTKEQYKAVLEMYANANFGTVMISGGKIQNDLHSGQDWDMDGFSVLFDYRFVLILEDVEYVSLSVTPDNKRPEFITKADLDAKRNQLRF